MENEYSKNGLDSKKMPNRFSNHNFADIDILFFLYETHPEAVAAMLPPPLKPMNPSIVTLNSWLIARDKNSSPLTGNTIFIPCKYKKISGAYCVFAATNTDWKPVFKNEGIGVPINHVQTTHTRKGSHVEVRVGMLGKEYITIQGDLNEQVNIIELSKELNLFSFKYTPGPDQSLPESNPRLMRNYFKVRYNAMEKSIGAINYSASNHEVLEKLACFQPVALLYGNIDVNCSCEVIATVNAKDFIPYLLNGKNK